MVDVEYRRNCWRIDACLYSAEGSGIWDSSIAQDCARFPSSVVRDVVASFLYRRIRSVRCYQGYWRSKQSEYCLGDDECSGLESGGERL